MTAKEAIERLVKQHLKMQVVVGKVKSVDETNMTCDVDLQSSPDMLDVRLRSVIDGQALGFWLFPK